MLNLDAIIKTWLKFIVLVWLGIAIAGCSVTNIFPNRESLPEVSPVSLPKLPDWIEEISPKGKAEPLAQIWISFHDPLIPIESLDSPDISAKLKQFEILPPLPGEFRFLTPRMVGFQASQALPKASRIKITLKAGLSDLKNHRLDQDLAWTFNTEPINLTIKTGREPENYNQSVNLKPTIAVTSNVELNLDSINQQVSLTPEGKNTSIPLKVELKPADSPLKPQRKFDPSLQNWIYHVTPQQNLDQATRYSLEFSPGLRPEKGNLSSTIAFGSQFTTYAPLKFAEIKLVNQPTEGDSSARFVKGSADLVFNNNIIPDSARENITINPAIAKDRPKFIRIDDHSNSVSINPWSLEPKTNYTINIGANLKDEFGQTLGKPMTVKYETGDVAPDIWAPSGLHIFPTGKDLQLNISTVNLPEAKYQAAFKVVQPTDLVYTDSAYFTTEGINLLPNPKTWSSFPVKSKLNQAQDITIPLRKQLGTDTGMLAYGVKAKTNRYWEKGKQLWREPENYGIVQLTNLGVFAQWFPDSGLIRVNHLTDGAAVANSSVEIYESKLDAKSYPQPSPCANGKTDQTGILLLNSQDLQKCLQDNPTFTEAPNLLVIAREGKDWAFVRTLSYSGAYGYGINGGWNSGKPESRGIIFSDRQLYQPGEKVQTTTVAYYLQNGTIKQDQKTRYTVTIESPDGKKTDLGTQITNNFGTFSLEIPLKPNQPLGYYALRAKGESGAEITGQFRVAEFKPPNFKVDLKLDQELALVNDKITANATSNYLFGAPVMGGKSTYYVTRQKVEFIPKGWEKFAFGPQWFWPEESPTVPSDVLQQPQTLNETGKSSQTINIANDLPYPMKYRVDVEVVDVSNLSVSNSQTFTALPSDRLIGLQSNFVADANKAVPIQVIVTDPTGKVKEGETVRIELQQMKYNSVTQVIEGSKTPRNQIEYKTIAKTEIKSAATPQSIALIPRESGSYRIRANFTDAKDDLTVTDLQIWVSGDNQVRWEHKNSRENYLEVKLDQDSYKVGETATALIQSPYPEAELYFAVVRHKILYQSITKVKGGAPQIKFTVTPEMLPNAAVEAVLVRQGVPLNQVEPDTLENLMQVGFAPFKTSLEDKYLQVQVTPTQAQVEPGTEQTVQLQLQDHQNHPVSGQFTVMVVNESVLQLSGYHPPDLVKTIYAQQAISTRFGDNRSDVVLEPMSSPLAKGWGYGGGFSTAAANTRTRKDFQALAYYNGSILTDPKGKAQINFKLPDDLTTWRIMAIASSEDLRFGNGDATFITTKPLISNPLLPQFARPSDRIEIGLSVTNNTQETGNLAITGSVNGGIKFDHNNPTTVNLKTQAKTGTNAYHFPIVAINPGKSQVKFTTELNHGNDAFEVPLEVKPLEITEQVVETGTTNNQVKIPLNVDQKVVSNVGGLEISLASTLIPDIIAPAQEVLNNEQLPFLEPTASQLAIATNLQILSPKYHQSLASFNPSQTATQSLSQLQKLQQPDGGFADFPGQKTSDPFLSPYTAQTLAQAAQVFPNLVDSGMVTALNTYLKKILADPGQYEFCKQQLCQNQIRLEALIALAAMGEKRNDFLSDIYTGRNDFALVNQIKLASYLTQFPEWKQQSKTLFDKIKETIYQTGRTATINIPENWNWLGSITTTQAQALRLAIAQNSKPETIDRLLTGLLALRRNGTWENTYDNAEALTALVEYSKLQPTPPNFNATVKLANKKLDSEKFEGDRHPNSLTNVAMDQLPRDRHDLILEKSGQGTLHYLVAYRYRLQGNQPGRFNGLRVTRAIRGANQTEILRQIGMYATDEPLSVAAGQVFDIGLEIIADHPMNQVVITDYLPAGFEAIDTSFKTATKAVKVEKDDFGFKNIYRDRIVAYSDRLSPGIYSLHYLVRSVTPGTFIWPGAEAHLQYSPEEFGRSASSSLVIKE